MSWNLEWTAKMGGYGVPDELAPSSEAHGTGTVNYYPGFSPPTCTTGFKLDPGNPPTLTQGEPFNSKSELTINVPDRIEDSAGGGTDSPSIISANSCPALIGGGPANYTITVPLHAGNHHA